jgi:hypothetical protein
MAPLRRTSMRSGPGLLTGSILRGSPQIPGSACNPHNLEGGISPAQIERIAVGMTQPAQSRHVNVPQASFFQRVWQRILIELWVVPRARHRPHIYHARHAMRLKKIDELLQRACGMSNR